MPGVHYAGLANNTIFTDCCDVAILPSQHKCPRCKKDIYPFYEGMSDQERALADGGYYNSQTDRARHAYAKRYKK